MTQWSGPNGPHYAEHPGDVPHLSDLCPGSTLVPLVMPFTHCPERWDHPWSWLNPSIADQGGHLYATVRASNFTIGEQGEYVIPGDGVTIRTANWLISLTDDLDVQGHTPLPMHPLGPDRHAAPVDGCEDLRLIRHNGRWLATCAVWDRGPGTAEQGLWDLAYGEIVMLHAPEPGPQKNWMPFVCDGELFVLYRVEPCVVLKVDRGQTVIAGWSTAGDDSTALLRGGSQGVPVNGGWLFVTHEACLQPRTYTHRLIRLDRDPWRVTAGPRWRFTDEPVEFCCGAVRYGSELIMSLGVGEQSGLFARVPLAEIASLCGNPSVP